DGAAVEVHAIAPRAEPEDGEPVADAGEGEIDLLPHGGRHADGRDVRRVREEVEARVAATTLVREDRRRDERVARVAIARHAGVTAAPIDPPRVDAAPPELRGREDVDEIASVARPAFDHEVEIPERADETAPRFLPRGSHRDHFRDEGVERRRYDASGGDA